MKIAVIAKTRLKIAEPFAGGLEAFTHAICKAYLQLGHSVTLYAHADSDPSLNVVGFYGDTYRNTLEFQVYENDEYLSILKDIESRDFDVVHNNSTHELPIIWGASASTPVVTTLHTQPISKLKAAIELASGSRNLHFVTISDYFKSVWQPYSKQEIAVIHNGVDVASWPLVRERNDHLLWYGRIVSAKGLDIALDAAHEVGLPLHFAGSIDDRSYYDEHVAPRISDDDQYVGHLSREGLLDEMRGAAALINATRWDEPFGLTTIEAMAAGVPVAGFDRGAFSEIVTQSSGAVADHSNVKALADAVRAAIALNSADVRKRAEEFSLDTMAHTYISLFGRLQ